MLSTTNHFRAAWLPIAGALLAALAAIALATACGPKDSSAKEPQGWLSVDFNYQSYPAELQPKCEIVVKRCTKCHTLDRVLVARISGVRHWTLYVERMRRMSGSGITRADASAAVDCLAYRSSLRDQQ